MTVSHWQETAGGQERVSHDVVVVGAGLIGSYMAGLLAESGRDTAVVEKHYPASGASGRNAGMVLLGMRDSYNETTERFGREAALEIWRMTDANVRRMRELSQKYEVEHEEIGTYYFGGSREGDEDLRLSAGMLEREGFSTEYYDRDPLDRGFGPAMLQPDDFATHPAQLTQALARTCGAALYENDEVFAIERSGAGMRVTTRSHVIECEKVMLAVNGYAGLVDPFFLPYVAPARGQVLLTEPAPRMLDVMCMNYKECYYRQLPDGRLLVGGGRWQHVEQEHTWSDEVTDNVQRFIASFIRRHFPEGTEAGVSRRWAGIHGMTEDGLPILGSLPHQPNVYFCVGFTGHGNSMGLVAGERAVDMMLNGTDPGVLSIERME